MMLLFYCFFQTITSQGINLASSDLSDSAWAVSGWSAITSGGTTISPYNTQSSQCNNQNILVLNNNYLTYQKTFTITDYEFYQLFIELDLYFYQFTQTTINIIVNTQNIYSQQFTSQILTLNNICGTGSDSQYTIYQGFYTTQQTLQIQIQYTQNTANVNSFIGIKNLNIYSNGIPLIGGCPMNTPLFSGASCGATCTTTNPFLTGQFWNQCGTGTNTSSALRTQFLTTANNFQPQTAPTAQEQAYLVYTGTQYLLPNSNIYTSSIMHSNLFSSQYYNADIYYFTSLTAIGATNVFQFIFTFYVFGEWNDGSYVAFYISGSTQYANNMVTISKQQGQYYSSTQSLFYNTNVTKSGVNTVAKKTLIGFSGRFFMNTVKFCVIQYLSGSTASYGFGNILIYKALADNNFAFPANTDIYGLPYTCLNGLFAYNGTCVATCPVFSFTSATNKNCTDYSSSESSIYNAAIPISQNAYGTYFIKLFYQNNFQQSDIDSLFQTKPPSYKNYLNSESFSFIQSKKILGGYNSWGYGTYQATFSNLKAHFQVRFLFTLYLIDGWQAGDTFTYQVDGAVVDTYTSNPSLQYQGLSTLDSIYIISGRKVSHGSSTLSISFNCNIAQKDASKASCGIQNLFVLIDQNVNILCPLNGQFFSYTSQNCENCNTSPCSLFPSFGITAKCSIGCLTCTSSSVCTACDTTNGYSLSGGVCNCLTNYIMVSSICQKCYYQCTTCSGTASNQCNTCDSTRTISSNTCPCNANYYDVQSITACAAITSTCHYSCSTCYGLQYNQCTTCPSASYRTFQSTSKTCPCDANYYDNGGVSCVSTASYTCDNSCLACSAAGNTNCTSCDSSKHRTTLSSGSCPCDSGFNEKLNVGNACVANYTPCHYSCSTCYGALETNCLTCLSANYRTLSSNSCPCNNGYTDINSAACIQNYTPCNYSCLTCFGATQNQCLTCPTTRNLSIVSIGTNSSCVCQDGTYNNNVATCSACNSICKTCTAAGSGSCSSCESTQNRTQSGTTCPCSTGYNEISNPGTCVLNYTPCHNSCLTCFGASNSNCITCSSANFRTISSNQCPCNSGYTEANVATCVASCSYSCLTCFGNSATQCSTCPTTRNLNIVMAGTNQSCDCQDGTFNNNVATCAACDSTCKTCTAAGNSSCSSCESTHNRTQSGTTCLCSTGYNEISNPGTCLLNYTPCHYSCQTCFGSSNTNCLTCPSGNYRTFSTNSCPCDGGYIDLSIQMCRSNYTPCHYSCLTCFGASGANCITCPATRIIYIIIIGTNQICECQSGTYNNNVATCVSCDSTCLTCSTAGSNNCSSCDSAQNRTQSGTSCPCSTGYNDILSPGNACVLNFTPCHFSCLTCYQSLNNNCLTCDSLNNRTYQQATNVCECDANYSDIGVANCLLNYSPCHSDCLNCFGPASNQCATCRVGRALNVITLGVNSSCLCSTNYYYSSGSSCLSCDSTCLTCDGGLQNNCSSCDIGVFRSLYGSTCPCQAGYNELLNLGTCVLNYTTCYSSCLTCFGSTSNQCISCNQNRSLNQNACSCSTHFNEIVNPGLCVDNYSPCNPNCDTCFGGLNNNCITCNPSNFRTFNLNTYTCPCISNYIDIGQVLCVSLYSPCEASCLTCFGDQIYQCVTCPPTRSLNYLSIGHQTCDCNIRYYEVTGLSQCSPCYYTCATCSGSFDLDCLTCNANRQTPTSACPCIANYNDLFGTLNDCQLNYSPCHLSCLTCFGGSANQCLDCPIGSLRTFNNTNQTCDCPVGYDNTQTVCTYICHNTCLYCDGPSQNDCLTCNTTVRQLLGSTCLCNNGTNDKLNPPTCVADITNPSCFAIQVLTCFGNSNNQALTCDSSLHRILNNNNICVCRSEFYEDSYFTCQECNPSCKTCNESTNSNCLTCDAAKNRVAVINASNQCPCITNYNDKLNFDEACVADITTCHYSCLTCYGIANNQCLTCPLSSFRTLNADLCECNSTYGDAGQAVCVLCHSSCLTCNGTQDNQCLSCDSALDRTLNGSTCPCSSGYNSLANSGVCTINYSPCHYSCDSCFGALANQCMGCGLLSSFHRVYQTDNTCPCDNNYIEQNSQQICIQLYSPCHFSCNQCIGSTLNDCANCPLNSNRTFNFGQCQCNSGYNDAANQQMCQLNYTPCDITCATCFGETSTQCLTCQSPLIMISGQCLCPVITNVFINNSCYPLITPCHYSCQTCINNLSTGCYQCQVNRTFLPTTGTNRVCNCIDGYFEDAANGNICVQCHYSCLTCQTTEQNCLTCSSLKFRQTSSNSCPCIQNYKEVNQICITCTNSDCLTCDNQQNCLTCVSEIKQVLNGLCVCIDGYYQQGANCYKCDSTCLTCNGAGIKQCLSCDASDQRIFNFGLCVCVNGYQENSNRQCTDCQSKEGILIFQCQYKNSQDKVWTYGEQCDDGNTDPRDGCDNQIIQPNYSCINIINEPSICYKCPDNCIKCIYVDNQVICSSCQDQYYNTQSSCIKCADSQCQYCVTPSLCSACLNNIIPQNGKCFNCQTGFYQVGYICQSECGDGIKTFDEECDDGNLQNGDGCSNQCSIEENFVCQTSSNISSCKMNSPPKLQITPVAMRQTNLKRFNIASNQNVLQQNVSLDIISNQSEFITLQYQVQNQSNDSLVAPLLIDVNLTFSQTFDYLDIVFVVNGLLNNEFNQDVSSRQLKTPVKDVQIMSNQEKQISSQVAQMGEGSVITFACVSASQLLLGGIQQFIQFLNMIQQLQYLQYINIQFPPNLVEFLNIFNGFTMMPLVKFVYLNNLLAIFNADSFTYVQPSSKFQANGINAYFLENIQGFFMSCISGVLLNYAFKGLIIILQNIKYSFEKKKFLYMRQIYRVLKKAQRFLMNSCDLFQKYGLIQLTLASCFDLQFAILIQLSAQNYDDANLTINSLLAFGFLAFYGVIIIKCTKFKDEELNDKVVWQSTFSSIKMIQASIFMFSIINLQDFPQCQVIIISLSSLTIALYTFAFRPLKDTFNNYKLIIQELSIFITNISFVGYIYFPTEINSINLGWFHIASYGTMIFCNLIIETYSNGSILKTMCQSKQKPKRTERNDSQLLIS